MGRRKNRSWALKWCSFFTSVAFLSTVGSDVKTEKNHKETENQTPSSGFGQFKPKQQTNSKNLMLVSTLDGKLSALDLGKSGSLDWAIDTGTGPLLSSSISKLEVNRNGVITRLIPSLDGGLYQFDGETVEPVPFTADTLLSSSFRFNDDSTIVGGKETETYGIDAKTGKIKYVCTINGCNNLDSDEEVDGQKVDSDDILIITRHTKTVRAVEMRTGAEKWNFSVGQHEVSYMSQKLDEDVYNGITDESGSGAGQCDDGVYIEEPCMDDEYPEHLFEFPWWGSDPKDCKLDVELKVIVPAGRVIAMSKMEPNKILWQYKFATGIANAWTLIDGSLEEVNLFDAANNPALAADESTIHPNMDEDIPDSPALFIGMHDKQMYVQPSVHMMQAVEEAVKQALHRGSLLHIDMPHITWNPYIASAPSRTPAVTEFRRPLHQTWDEMRDQEILEEERSLALWHEAYPYDSGFYLMADPFFGRDKYYLTEGEDEEPCEDCDVPPEDFSFDHVTHTLWNWKEVMMFGIFMSVVTHIFIEKVIYKRKIRTQILRCGDEPEVEGTVEAMEVKPEEISIIEKQPEFVSRYYIDFEQDECLGKGGFGVVFKARNKVDDCHYAIKRISLNKSDKAKEKVMREVKALANLEHPGIVRYNQAWFESPPPGWQEERDKDLVSDDNSVFSTKGFSISEYVPNHSKIAEVKHKGNEDAKPSNFNPLRPFEDPLNMSWSNVGGSENTINSESGELEGDSDSNVNPKRLVARGSSEGFTPRIEHDLEWDESGSYSLGAPSLNATLLGMDDSLSIDFVDMETSKDNTNLPFRDVGDTTGGSLDIIFEDSKRSDNSESSHKYTSEMSDAHESLKEDDDSISFEDSTSGVGDSVVKFKNSKDFKNVEDSVDIVFEDSGCGDKSRSNQSENISQSEDPILDISFNRPASQTGTISKSSKSNDTVTSGSPPRPGILNLSPVMERKHAEAAEKETPLPRLYLYIQMQLCRKESLRDWLAENTLNRDRCKLTNIFGEIVSAMDYVHDQGLMHRDLKPSNIFFSLDGTVKIGDFGLVTQAEEECLYRSGKSARTPMSPYFSKHTGQVGTKLYMSPEQNAGKPYDHKVDIYAMGLIFFELFYPFATAMERIKTLMEVKRVKFPPRFARELPQECEFVKKLLSHIPDERPNTNDILEHSILLPYHDAKESYRRNRTSSRNRTVSTSSSENSIPNTP